MRRTLLAVALAAAAVAPARADDRPWLAPPALVEGDTVALVAPCGICEEDDARRFADSLTAAGFRVVVEPEIHDRRHRYLAGTDDERAAELDRAIRNPAVRGIFVLRGGFGLTRILDRIDYDALRRDPKVIVGYSDVTALHVAAGRRARLVTFHAPMASAVKVVGEDPSFAEQSYRDMLFLEPAAPRRMIPLPEGERPTTVTGGQCTGRLVGGNLSLIAATIGTPYAIDTKGCVLFLEDVNERPYRVDRLLSQLRLAGLLDGLVGVVVGRFTCDDYEGEKKEQDEREQREVVLEYCKPLGCPVVADFPCGHVRDNVTLPLGARVTLDADAGTLEVIEPSCLPRSPAAH